MIRQFVMLAAVGLVACSGSPPVVDRRGLDEARYDADRRECKAYARGATSDADPDEAVKDCLRGRGYKVLN